MNIVYPVNLPVSAYITEIKSLLIKNQVIIVSGNTGTGKTTQLPKILYEVLQQQKQQNLQKDTIKIGHTQPRRLATKLIAKRLTEELVNANLESVIPEHVVAYKIRFTDKTNNDTIFKIMTDGILLQEIKTDTDLKMYNGIIIDEAHERTLNIDFLLAYLKLILKKRSDLKVIITSATIDNKKLSKFFNDAPVFEINARTYPINILYRPLDAFLSNKLTNLEQKSINHIDSNYIEDPLYHGIYLSILECLSIAVGDILIFLSGEREIHECIKFLNKQKLQHKTLKSCQFLPLYARQNEQEQNSIHQNNNYIKIIITTNIAETSITLPSMQYVIDSGEAKVNRYNNRYKIEQLQTEKISQANIKQRIGRVGRVRDGTAILLFSEDDYNSRVLYPDPEIARSNLANVLIKLLELNISSPFAFPFVDKPSNALMLDALKTLYQLNLIKLPHNIALNDFLIDTNNISNNTINTAVNTRVNRLQLNKLAYLAVRLPLDINLSTIVINAAIHTADVLDEIIIIVSYLSVADPKIQPFLEKDLSLMRHSIWHDSESDFIAILNLWYWYLLQLKHKKSNKILFKNCEYQFVSLNKLKQWQHEYQHLKEILINMHYKINDFYHDINTQDGNISRQSINEYAPIIITQQKYQKIHKVLLSGFLYNIAKKDFIAQYFNGSNGKKVFIHPSTGVKKIFKPDTWIVSGVLLQTNKLYARMIAKIDVKYLENISDHLVTYSYDNPVWHNTKKAVVVTKISNLYGLVIKRQSVLFHKINPILSRELFIKNAMIELWEETFKFEKYEFLKHNQKVIQKVTQLEEKLRIKALIITDELYNFYNTYIPIEINNYIDFNNWYQSIFKNSHLEYNSYTMNSNTMPSNTTVRASSQITKNELLYLNYNDLLAKLDHKSSYLSLYPDYILYYNNKYCLNYIFDIDHKQDGVTAKIKLDQLVHMPTAIFTYLVPGLIRDKITAMVKLLPKQIKIKCNPINEFINHFLEYLSENYYYDQLYQIDISVKQLCKTTMQSKNLVTFTKAFYDYLNQYKSFYQISHCFSINQLDIEFLETNKLPTYLKCHFEIYDKNYKITSFLAAGDNIEQLKIEQLKNMQNILSKNIDPIYRIENITSWIDDLSKLLTYVKQGFFGLIYDNVNNSVNLMIFTTLNDAIANTKIGIYYLLRLNIATKIKLLYNKKWLHFKETVMYFNGVYTIDNLLQQSVDFIVRQTIDIDSLFIVNNLENAITQLTNNISLKFKTEYDFKNYVIHIEQTLFINANLFGDILYIIAKNYHFIKQQVSKNKLNSSNDFYISILDHLDDLIYTDFLKYVKFVYFERYPKYLLAIIARIEKYKLKPAQDSVLIEGIESIYNKWYNYVDYLENNSHNIEPQIYDFKYKFEELKIITFTPNVKPLFKVSAKRLSLELDDMIKHKI